MPKAFQFSFTSILVYEKIWDDPYKNYFFAFDFIPLLSVSWVAQFPEAVDKKRKQKAVKYEE